VRKINAFLIWFLTWIFEIFIWQRINCSGFGFLKMMNDVMFRVWRNKERNVSLNEEGYAKGIYVIIL
jgi:hypothetical protein